MALRHALTLGSLPWLLFGCQSSSSDAGPLAVSGEIGPEGGSLIASDGTRVDVPPGALPAVATLTLHPAADAAVPPGAVFAAGPWTLEPEWLQFAAPIQLTFPVTGAARTKGPLVATSAFRKPGYQALAAWDTDAGIAARATHFDTGGPIVASCPVTCSGTLAREGSSLRCASTCLGHTYTLSCEGPPASTPCSCAIDGVVTGAVRLDTTDAGTPVASCASFCDFPGSSVTLSLSAGDAGPD